MRSAPVLTLFLVASLVGLSGCTGNEAATVAGPAQISQPDEGKGQVVVTIIDDTDTPIQGAQVAIVDVTPPLETLTDDVGVAVFNNLDPGPHSVAATKLGYSQAVSSVQVGDGETVAAELRLRAIEIRGAPYHAMQIGQGYIACGLYTPAVTVSNLNVCAWDTNHRPRFEFQADRAGLEGVLQEVVWARSSGVTSEKLIVYLWYKPVCNPTCSGTKEYGAANAGSPVRVYSDLSGEKFEEEKVPLASMTFVGGKSPEVVFVFQQRISHYVTTFYNAQGDPGNYTAIPAQ